MAPRAAIRDLRRGPGARPAAAGVRVLAMAVPEIDPLDLKRLLDSGAVTVLDVREPWECEIAQLRGSLNIPLGEITGRLPELDPAAVIGVMCKMGGRRRRAAECLQSRVYRNVSNLAGGIDAWTREIDPSLASY